jgi:hypothetical protein
MKVKSGSSVNIHLKSKWDNGLGLSNLVGWEMSPPSFKGWEEAEKC